MKNKVLSSLLIAFSFSASIGATESTTGTKSFYLSGGAIGAMFDDDRNLDNALAPFGALGYQFDPNIAVELNYLTGNADFDGMNGDTDFSLLSLMGIYRFEPVGTDSVLARGGFGSYDFSDVSDSSEMAARLGLGYEKYIQPNLSVNAFADLVTEFDDGGLDMLPGVGLTYYFGTQQAPAPKTPEPIADSDKDGIADNLDQCPNTPMGQRVDAKGCELDDDKDGVVNRLDQCPATRTGVSVDRDGCELDSDNDGVVDSMDQCQATPVGAKVDRVGCQERLKEVVTMDLNIQFANNSLTIESAYTDKLKELAKFMTEYPSANVVIEGHTDSVGSAGYNQRLSQQRADAVRQYLIDNFGIAADRISAVGKGEAEPIADNNTETGRRQNRRVIGVVSANN